MLGSQLIDAASRLTNSTMSSVRWIIAAPKRIWAWVWAHPKSASAGGLLFIIFLGQDALIEPITIPTALNYDGHVAACRLGQHILRLQREARAYANPTIRPLSIDPSFLQLPDFSVGGLTIDPFAMLAMLQHYLKLGTHFIAGEMTRDGSGKRTILTLHGS